MILKDIVKVMVVIFERNIICSLHLWDRKEMFPLKKSVNDLERRGQSQDQGQHWIVLFKPYIFGLKYFSLRGIFFNIFCPFRTF